MTANKKKIVKEQEIKFTRPPWFEEVVTADNKKRFNNMPGWQRHYIKELIKHADLDKAAKAAGISRHHKANVDTNLVNQKDIRDVLTSKGLDTDFIVDKIREACEVEVIRFDKHGNPVVTIDIPARLKAIDMLLKVRGDYDLKTQQNKDKTRGLVDLFEDTKIADSRPKAITVDSKESQD